MVGADDPPLTEAEVLELRDRLAEPDCANGVIFDGFPRTTAQAAALEVRNPYQGL